MIVCPVWGLCVPNVYPMWTICGSYVAPMWSLCGAYVRLIWAPCGANDGPYVERVVKSSSSATNKQFRHLHG